MWCSCVSSCRASRSRSRHVSPTTSPTSPCMQARCRLTNRCAGPHFVRMANGIALAGSFRHGVGRSCPALARVGRDIHHRALLGIHAPARWGHGGVRGAASALARVVGVRRLARRGRAAPVRLLLRARTRGAAGVGVRRGGIGGDGVSSASNRDVSSTGRRVCRPWRSATPCAGDQSPML